MSIRLAVMIVASVAWLSACTSASVPSDAAGAPKTQTAAVGAPQKACGQTDGNADFENIARGTLVRIDAPAKSEDVAQNWSPDMSHYVGQVTRVTERLGVDKAGCPGVRLEADAGVFFWRVQNLEVVASKAPDDRCGQNALTANYMGLQIGQAVQIHALQSWYGDDNAVDEMHPYEGKTSRITGRSGVDNAGCPGVTLAIDDGLFFWRVRDLRPVSQDNTETDDVSTDTTGAIPRDEASAHDADTP